MIVALPGERLAEEVDVGLLSVPLGNLPEGAGEGVLGLSEQAQIQWQLQVSVGSARVNEKGLVTAMTLPVRP